MIEPLEVPICPRTERLYSRTIFSQFPESQPHPFHGIDELRRGFIPDTANLAIRPIAFDQMEFRLERRRQLADRVGLGVGQKTLADEFNQDVALGSFHLWPFVRC